MAADDRVLDCLRRPPRRWRSIWAVWGFATVIGLASQPLGILVFIIGLLWILFSKRQIPKSYFSGNAQFQGAAIAILKLSGAWQFRYDNDLSFSYVSRFKNLRAKEPFLVIDGGTPNTLVLTPERYGAYLDGVYSAGETQNIGVKAFNIIIQSSDPSPGDEVIKREWMHPTKSGGRDYRYKDDELITVRRFGIELTLINGTEWNIALPSRSARDSAISLFYALTGTAPTSRHSTAEDDRCENDGGDTAQEDTEDDDDGNGASQEEPIQECRSWSDVLGINPNASRQAIKEARDRLVRGFHPDRLKSIEGLNPEIEKYATQKLVEINLAYEEAMNVLKGRG